MFLRRRVLIVVVPFVIAIASVAWAQRFRVMEGPGMPLRMLPVMLSVPSFSIPPPPLILRLPLMVLPVMVSVP